METEWEKNWNVEQHWHSVIIKECPLIAFCEHHKSTYTVRSHARILQGQLQDHPQRSYTPPKQWDLMHRHSVGQHREAMAIFVVPIDWRPAQTMAGSSAIYWCYFCKGQIVASAFFHDLQNRNKNTQVRMNCISVVAFLYNKKFVWRFALASHALEAAFLKKENNTENWTIHPWGIPTGRKNSAAQMVAISS